MIVPRPPALLLSRALAVAALVALVAAIGPGPARADEPTAAYVVQPGDSCMSIAIKQLGDSRQLATLHRLNPQLGPDTPHVLVPGQVLTLPRVATGPDARLTGKSGVVRVRPPATPDWDAARRGMDLFRAWRVGAEARSSAEVTYTDNQQRLQLREHTVVVIYGPERRRARTTSPEVVLERGALRTRLGELSGQPAAPIKVQTPSATAELGAGSAVIAVADDGLSTVANHDGGAIALRSKTGGQVAVASGMGTRVATGKPPEKPRKLPAAPAWITGATAFVAVDGLAQVSADWRPAARAASYRFELSRGDALVAAAELPAAITRFELHGAPPGDYTATVASLDADRLEGKPGPALALVVRAITLAPPGADVPAAIAPPADDEPIAPLAAPAPRRTAVGTRAIADGLTCEAGGSPGAITVLTAPGALALRCTGPGGLAFAPLALDVVAVETTAVGRAQVQQGQQVAVEIALRADAALGDAWQLEPSPGLTVDGTTRTPGGLRATVTAAANAPASSSLRVVDATTQRTAGTVAITVTAAAVAPPPPPETPPTAAPGPTAPPRLRIGAFAGWTYLPTGDNAHQLGDPPIADYVAQSGGTVGLRAAWWRAHPEARIPAFVEVELGATPTRFVGADERAWVYGAHAYLGLATHPRWGLTGTISLGGGVFALRTDARFADDDIDANLAGGFGLIYALDRRIRARIDGRYHLALWGTDEDLANASEGSDGTIRAVELNLGVEVGLF